MARKLMMIIVAGVFMTMGIVSTVSEDSFFENPVRWVYFQCFGSGTYTNPGYCCLFRGSR